MDKIKLIEAILSCTEQPKCSNKKSFYIVGDDYVLRTVTMIYLGQVKEETEDAIILEDCAWIPDTSRWSEFLQGKKPQEMEPYNQDVIVYKGALLDATRMTKKIKRELI
ncbi:MAG: hypothetical protein KDD50_15695 [Bdellovibrionales bacterium]|nr:hypothetical protein [Bdellovibrionales bacterium]